MRQSSIASFREARNDYKGKSSIQRVLALLCVLGFTLFVITISLLLKPSTGNIRARDNNLGNFEPSTTNSSSVPGLVSTGQPTQQVTNEHVLTLAPSTLLAATPPSDPSTPNPFKAPVTTPPPTYLTTHVPSDTPSSSPSDATVSYYPGNLSVFENQLELSVGLTSRIIATTDMLVEYSDGRHSNLKFHPFPDFGATFVDPSSDGGWIYVSNSEVRRTNFTAYPQKGGVGALTFDKDGNVLDYRMVLTDTEANCGGGRTPWNTWISCEEQPNGVLWQVDPTGERESEKITLGLDGGHFESFAYDIRHSHFFVTEDAERGALRRFSPDHTNTSDSWEILHGPGVTEFLLLFPRSDNASGTYTWTRDHELAKENARLHYRNAEGIDVSGNLLFFVSKNLKRLYTLNLDTGNYTSLSTVSGLFDGAPDQLQRVVGGPQDLLYFTEEGGRDPGGKTNQPL